MNSGVRLRTALLVFPLVLSAQSVVSINTGVIHYFEGSVYIDGKPLEQHFGRFEEIRPGSELRTDRGRAEVLLTPGVLLRLDENSSLRMVTNRLSDTKVAFLGGSMAIDSRNGAADAPITITFQNYEVHFKTPGCYRFDSTVGRLRIDQGEADVAFMGKHVSATGNHTISFTPQLTAGPYVNNLDDGLDRWAQDRSQSVASDNASATASDKMTADIDNAPDPGYDAAGLYGGGGGYGGGRGYGGGGYSMGVDPALMSPTDLWYTGANLAPWVPLSSWYSAPLFGYIIVPGYRRSPILGYRPYEPIRHGPYVPPSAHRPLLRTTPVPVHRSYSGATTIHSGIHAGGGHR